MVEDIEELRPELGSETLLESKILTHGQIPVSETRVPPDVAPRRTEGPGSGRNQDGTALGVAAEAAERSSRWTGIRSTIHFDSGRLASTVERSTGRGDSASRSGLTAARDARIRAERD